LEHIKIPINFQVTIVSTKAKWFHPLFMPPSVSPNRKNVRIFNAFSSLADGSGPVKFNH